MDSVLKSLGDVDTPLGEYWYHVARQDQMPLAGTRRTTRVLDSLDAKFPDAASYASGALNAEIIASWLLEDPDIAHELRLVLSITDKRFYLDLSYLFSRVMKVTGEGGSTLCGCPPSAMKRHTTQAILGKLRRGPQEDQKLAAKTIADYLIARRLLVVLDLYFSMSPVERSAINDFWLAPHDVQQNETKRRGHGAEAEIADALARAGVLIVPANKATDPMGAPDPNIDLRTFAVADRVPGETFSTDIAVTDQQGNLRAMVMGLVQSSDPGQFGVDKAATNRTIRDRLDEFRGATGSSLELWGIVDGIGYSENPNGTLVPMLDAFHEFFQHNSAYKVLLAAHRIGLIGVNAVRYDESFYTQDVAEVMHHRYAASARMLRGPTEAAPAAAKEISVGRATVYLD